MKFDTWFVFICDNTIVKVGKQKSRHANFKARKKTCLAFKEKLACIKGKMGRNLKTLERLAICGSRSY